MVRRSMLSRPYVIEQQQYNRQVLTGTPARVKRRDQATASGAWRSHDARVTFALRWCKPLECSISREIPRFIPVLFNRVFHRSCERLTFG
jgi:hypothetical protein